MGKNPRFGPDNRPRAITPEVYRPEVVITPEAKTVLRILIERAFDRINGREDRHKGKIVAVVDPGGGVRSFKNGFVITALLRALDEDRHEFPIRKSAKHKFINPYLEADLLVGNSAGAINHTVAVGQEPGSLDIYLEKIATRLGPQRMPDGSLRRPTSEDKRNQILALTKLPHLNMDALGDEIEKHLPDDDLMQRIRPKVFSISSSPRGDKRITLLNNKTKKQRRDEVIAASWIPLICRGKPIILDGQVVIDGGFANDAQADVVAAELGATHILVLPTFGDNEFSEPIPRALLPIVTSFTNNHIANKLIRLPIEARELMQRIHHPQSRPPVMKNVQALGGIYTNGSQVGFLSTNNERMRAEGNDLYGKIIDCMDEIAQDIETDRSFTRSARISS